MGLLHNPRLTFHELYVLLIVILLLLMPRLVVKFLQRWQVKLARVEVPEDVLEIEGAPLIVDKHHGGEMVISVEVMEWVLKNVNK